ncbi:hypothetical protein TKK_0011853 [Trichogramma kaykai]
MVKNTTETISASIERDNVQESKKVLAISQLSVMKSINNDQINSKSFIAENDGDESEIVKERKELQEDDPESSLYWYQRWRLCIYTTPNLQGATSRTHTELDTDILGVLTGTTNAVTLTVFVVPPSSRDFVDPISVSSANTVGVNVAEPILALQASAPLRRGLTD